MAWLHQGWPGQSGNQEVAVSGRARAGAPRANALVPSGMRLKEAVLWLGRYSGGPLGGLRQVSPLSLFLYVSVFYFCLCFLI